MVDTVPLFLPAIPFAFVLGVTIVDSGIGNLLGWSTSPIVFAGAAQLTLVSLLGGGAAWATAVATPMIVNARHIMYSAALAPTFQRQPTWFRWVGPYLLIDQLFVIADAHKHERPEDFRRYYLGAGLTFFTLWSLFVAVGLVVGPVVPEEWGLAFAIPIMFTGMLVAGLDSAPKWTSAVVAAVVTALCASVPNRAGLLIGAAAGIVAGIAVDRGPRDPRPASEAAHE